MRKNIGVKPYMYPMPVLIIGTYDEEGKANAMNAAWGVICDVNKVAIYLDARHKTVENILKRGAFTVSMADEKNAVSADYVGIVSGNDVPDKVEKAGWHAMKSSFVDAPLFEELSMTLECTMESFDEESECMVGVIRNISVDEDAIDSFSPIAYDPVHGVYRTLGESVGKAFSIGLQLKK